MLSLYRRHRPRTFEEVVGQDHIVRTLRNAITLDKVHHAYLFVGSRGTGKTSTAKLLACALNAEGGPRTDFSRDDPACQAIASGTSLDVVEMDAASNNSVDDIRELRENVALAPMGGGRRVYILDEAHMLSPQAWNAFLKTLEEPPAHVVFVLATTEAHKVPATIVDRCHRFDFHRPSSAQVVGVLERVAAEEGIEVPEPAFGMIARAATGSFRDALGTLEQLVTYGGPKLELEDVLEVLGVADAELVLEAGEALVEHDPRAALLAVEHLSASGRDLTQFVRDFSAHLRHLFVVQTLDRVPDSLSVTAEHTERLQAQASRLAQGEILRAIDLLAAALGAIKDGAEPRIQLELALLKSVQPEVDLSLPALLFRIEQLEARLAEASPGGASEGGPARGAAETDAGPGADGRANGVVSPLAAAAAPSPPAAASVAPVPVTTTASAAAPALAPAAGRHPAEAPTSVGSSGAMALAAEPEPEPAEADRAPAAAPDIKPGSAPVFDLEGIRGLWPAAVDVVRSENQMVGALLSQARPVELDAERLTICFPPEAEFSKRKAEANRGLLRDALAGLTGLRLDLQYEVRDEGHGGEVPTLSGDELVEKLKAEFGATEILDDDEPEPS